MTGETASRAPVHAIAGFARELRAAGVPADHTRVATAVRALSMLPALEAGTTYWTLRVALCSSPADLAIFDAKFRRWFGEAPSSAALTEASVGAYVAVSRTTAAPSGRDDDDDDEDEAGMVASDAERLRTAAFDELSSAERAEVNRLIALLRPRGARRRSRRSRPGRGRAYDASRTARAMLRNGGDVAALIRRQPRVKLRRVVLLLDVSGSMTPYSDVLLRFAHAAVQVAPYRTEVFTMGTRLTRVTRELRARDPNIAIRAAGEAIPDWSGGTRLGESLQAFLDRWGQRGAARQATVVIASDGWERGDAALLGRQAARLALLATSIVWVNPHRGKPGFTAATAGMQAVAPYLDDLVAGHNLQALTELAEVIARA
jgi:hypothetical protein